MAEVGNKIQLMLNQEGKIGIVMIRENYSLLSEFILRTIKEREKVRLNDLLEKARHQGFPGLFNQISWSLLQVKLDLEARGLIMMHTTTKTHRLPFIRLTRKGEKAIRGKESMGIKDFYLLLVGDDT